MKKIIYTGFILIASLSLFAQFEVMPPELIAPLDDATNRMPDVVLDWNPVSAIGPVVYTTQLDTSDLFSNPQVFETDLSSVQTSDLLFGTEYFWRVKATDNTGSSDWSTVFSFTTFNQLTQSQPVNHATDKDVNVKIEWKTMVGPSKVSGVTHFDYEFSIDDAFTNPVSGTVAFSTFPENPTSFYAYAQELLFGTKYYWRVRARHDTDHSDWSATWDLTTKGVVPLTSPGDDTTNLPVKVTLRWVAYTGVYGYFYEFCKDPNFATPCQSTSETNSAVVEMLEFDMTYYWRVRAFHNQDTTDWSATWSFTTLNQVTLSTPANGSHTNMLPTLDWVNVDGATGYEVQYDDAQNFTEPVVNITGPDTSQFQVLYALDNGTYYWRVRAMQDGDTTSWSNVWSFIVGGQAINESVFGKSVVDVYPNPAAECIHLDLSLEKPLDLEVTIVDFLGQTCYRDKYFYSPGHDPLRIDATALKNGIYFLRLQSGMETYSEKLIINR